MPKRRSQPLADHTSNQSQKVEAASSNKPGHASQVADHAPRRTGNRDLHLAVFLDVLREGASATRLWCLDLLDLGILILGVIGAGLVDFLFDVFHFLASFLGPVIGPVADKIIGVSKFIRKWTALAFRCVYVFFYFLRFYTQVRRPDTAVDVEHWWTLSEGILVLPFNIDIGRILFVICAPVRVYQRWQVWRKRRMVRVLKPKAPVGDVADAQPHLRRVSRSQRKEAAAFGGDCGRTATWKPGLADVLKEEMESEQEEEENIAGPSQPVSIGRKEPKRGRKKKKRK